MATRVKGAQAPGMPITVRSPRRVNRGTATRFEVDPGCKVEARIDEGPRIRIAVAQIEPMPDGLPHAEKMHPDQMVPQCLEGEFPLSCGSHRRPFRGRIGLEHAAAPAIGARDRIRKLWGQLGNKVVGIGCRQMAVGINPEKVDSGRNARIYTLEGAIEAEASDMRQDFAGPLNDSPLSSAQARSVPKNASFICREKAP